MSVFFRILIGFCAMGLPLAAEALGPMDQYQDLVAGEGTAGLEDGPFYSALFQSPQGLAVEPAGKKLYVADGKNHCIRVVDFENENRVSTLTGQGKPGFEDGDFSVAKFNQPSLMLFLTDRQIVVNDEGNARIRLIDMEKKTVSTLAGSGTVGVRDGKGPGAQLGNIASMAYLPSRNGLYFTQPAFGELRKLDLRTGEVTTLFRNNRDIPQPAAMAVANGKLYLADQAQPQVYELNPSTSFAKEDETSFKWTPFAKGQNILRMAWSGNILYALQVNDDAPLARLTPDYQPITFFSLWGEMVQQLTSYTFFSEIHDLPPMDFVPDPSSERKFYISHPYSNNVTSFRDLFFYENRSCQDPNKDGLTDFLYPLAKPPRTFRILMLGDSRIFHFSQDDINKRGLESDNRFCILPKRLEVTLNTLAALKDVPLHFEVLHHGEVPGDPLMVWPYYVVPNLVKKFDIDLVLFMLSPNFDLNPFYEYPMTSEQIPAMNPEAEYLLKPYQERIQEGLPKKLFDLCGSRKKVSISTNNQIRFSGLDDLMPYPEIVDCAAELYSRPIKLLKEKLDGTETPSGKKAILYLCLFPYARTGGTRTQAPFWKKVLEDSTCPSLDLTPEMTSFRVSFYPISEINGNDHLDANGHLWMGFLLANELIDQKLIPFVPSKNH